MEKIYEFYVNVNGAVTRSEVIAYLVDDGRITEEQAKTYEPTDEDIVNAIWGGLAYEEIHTEYGEGLFVDFNGDGDFVEVE